MVCVTPMEDPSVQETKTMTDAAITTAQKDTEEDGGTTLLGLVGVKRAILVIHIAIISKPGAVAVTFVLHQTLTATTTAVTDKTSTGIIIITATSTQPK